MRHGGDLHAATQLYGMPPSGWLDLSTGVNPRPYPGAENDWLLASLRRLPSPEELAALLATARAAYEATDAVSLAAAPGTEVLIRMLPDLAEGPAALADTSYRSYREAWRKRGRELPVVTPEQLADRPETSAILVNPNNPDGRLLTAREILAIARSRAPGAVVIVDEAYADTQPGASVVPHLRASDPVLVLKSFGKFFGLPGLRLGFAIGSPALVGRVAERLGDWPVSGPAIAIGRAALADAAWQAQSRHWMGNQAQALDGILKNGGLDPVGGCRLFRLARMADAAAVHTGLARQGIWTRLFDDRPGFIRFGLPPDMTGLGRLADALAGA